MKARLDAIIQREQAEYLDGLHTQNNELLAEMEDYAGAYRVPIADREVARFLEITARSIGARRALEIGMAIGYSVINLLRGMGAGGVVTTIEPSEEMIDRADVYLKRAGVTARVKIERGFALDVLPRLEGEFDLVYLDAVKEEYSDYLRLSLPLLRAGGVIIADNLLWGGRVAAEARPADEDASTKALRIFNREFVAHPQLLAQVLPVGDGLGYGVKI